MNNTLIIDVGCSFTKLALYDKGITLLFKRTIETSESPYILLEDIEHELNMIKAIRSVDIAMVISYSDSIFYEYQDGKIGRIPPTEKLTEIQDKPPYEISGKPENTVLQGMATQLLTLAKSHQIKTIKRILPPSTFIAAKLSGNETWNHWDITHASNSGMFDYKIAAWSKWMQPIIGDGVINRKIKRCGDTLNTSEIKWLVGGHDSVFIIANHPYYSTRPYLSLGTWITASIESWFKPVPKQSVRYVIAPNNTILAQICYPSNLGIKPAIEFFERRRPNTTVTVFGNWIEEVHDELTDSDINFDMENAKDETFLHAEAAKYAQRKARHA